VAGVGEADLAADDVHGQRDQGARPTEPGLPDDPVDVGDHLARRRTTGRRRRPDGAPEVAHGDRRFETPLDDVAHRHAEPAVANRKEVVPVPLDRKSVV
jgi:hypothetical protein